VRAHGPADTPGNLGLSGHACWTYVDQPDLLRAALPFLAEGRRLGQRLMFVGGPSAEQLVREVEPLSTMVAEGDLQVAPFDAIYPGGRRMSNEDQWNLYSTATDQALAEGCSGLRVVAEVTSLAVGGEWPGQAAWETYADRLMANRPLAALCCFDRSALDDTALAAIACAHPVADSRLRTLAPWHLYGEEDALALSGEVDMFSADVLELLLRSGEGTCVEEVLDVTDLDFIDHVGMQVLQQHGARLRATGGRLTLRGESTAFTRVAELVGGV
jgi:anti-anti-sigma factor